MRRIFIICAFACGLNALDFSHCRNYYKQATTTIDSTLVYSVMYNNKPHLIAFSKTPLKSKNIIKKDVFLGLYLLKGQTPLSYTLKPLDNFSRTRELSAINAKDGIKGRVINFEKGIFDLGKFSSNLPKDSVISNICYQIYGIRVDSRFFMPKILIDRFLSEKGGIYGDIGIRVAQNKNDVAVTQIDLFFPDNPFKQGDKILAINKKKIKNLVDFEWSVANLAPKSVAKVTILRANKRLELDVKVDYRYGGGLISDTFFERFGVVFDNNLVIRHIAKELPFSLSQLSVGDELIWINKIPVRKNDGFWHLRQLFSQVFMTTKEVELLVLHEGVQVFIRSKLK